MKKLAAILLITAFLISTISMIPNARSSNPALALDKDLEGIDGTAMTVGIMPDPVEIDEGNPWILPVINFYTGGYYGLAFNIIVSGTYANVWIGLSTRVWTGGHRDHYHDNGAPGYSVGDEWHFAYPWSYDATIAGFPASMTPYYDVIYYENLTYVLNEFDTNIHDTTTGFFGMYAPRAGPLGDYKVQILIFNFRDGLFYDPPTAPWFVEGYFWGVIADYYGANVFHMDTYQWYRRLGPNPQPDPRGYPPRPLEYEGTFAHEFQHLIQHDLDADEDSWVNEGLSTLAEYINGYGFSPSHIEEYLWYWWWDSLVIWQGELSDYGVVFLWTFYMYEHYHSGVGPGTLIWDVAHDPLNGIAGWNSAISAHGIPKDFDAIFQDWAIANYLDDTSFAGGIYGYYALDIPSADTNWVDIPYTMAYWDYAYPSFFDTMVVKMHGHYDMGWEYPYGANLPYIVNYVKFEAKGTHALTVDFYGDPVAGVIPHSGMYEWHSDGVAWSWFRLGQTFSIPTTGATLNFWNYYQIEEDWDYGYVEVHDLNTGQWYTLPGLGTISTIPNPQNNPNCPSGLEPTDYLAAGRWNAFTGSSGGWYQETMDLTPFAGHNIELYFTYWTDGYVLELGWYIDDIAIPELGFYDNVESGPDGWSTNGGWYITDGLVTADNDHSVNFITKTKFSLPNETPYEETTIIPMVLNDLTESGTILLPMINRQYVKMDSPVMVIAAQPGFEHTFATSYVFFYSKEPMPKLF